jgi:hypothetical protein
VNPILKTLTVSFKKPKQFPEEKPEKSYPPEKSSSLFAEDPDQNPKP